jgi:outer membrane lipoprotein-sorting protein
LSRTNIRRDRNPGALCDLCARSLATIVASVFVAACAPKAPSLPAGSSTPFPPADFQAAYQHATAACGGINTVTLTANLSGRAGATKLHGRVDAGFAAPARARLEGIPPFGKRVFVLVAEGDRGTLVLPREDRVLGDARPEEIVAALTGVSLDAASLRTIVTGCGFPGAPPSGDQARRFANGWVSAPAADGAVFLHSTAAGWSIAVATRGPLTVMYSEESGGRPAAVRLRAEDHGRATADLTLRLSEVEINTTLDPRTFDITPDLPAHPVPLTLDELRRAGPLGGG